MEEQIVNRRYQQAQRMHGSSSDEGTAKTAFKGMPFPWQVKQELRTLRTVTIKYGDGVYQATFVGYFPADKPQYTCIVVISTKPHAAAFWRQLGSPGIQGNRYTTLCHVCG